MDTEELICKCKAISIQEGSESKLSYRSGMKEKRGHIVANLLVGKILLARSIHTEEIRTTLVQAWRTNKEVKIENLESSVFLFKFDSEVDKIKVMAGGPWHFDRALIILEEPSGVGNIRKQKFMHATFKIQFHMHQ